MVLSFPSWCQDPHFPKLYLQMFPWNTQNSLMLHFCTFSMRIIAKDTWGCWWGSLELALLPFQLLSRFFSEQFSSLLGLVCVSSPSKISSSSIPTLVRVLSRIKFSSSLVKPHVEVQVESQVSQDKSKPGFRLVKYQFKFKLKSVETSPSQVWILLSLDSLYVKWSQTIQVQVGFESNAFAFNTRWSHVCV